MDLGGQWVHGQSRNIVFELASKYDLLSLSAGQFYNPDKHEVVTINEIIPKEESNAVLMIYFNIIKKLNDVELETKEGSLADYFIKE